MVDGKDDPAERKVERLRDHAARIMEHDGNPSSYGGGGGSSGGTMEARIAKLEAQHEQMAKSIDKILSTNEELVKGQATLLERSQHLASKNYIGVVVVSATVVLGVFIALLRFLESAPA